MKTVSVVNLPILYGDTFRNYAGASEHLSFGKSIDSIALLYFEDCFVDNLSILYGETFRKYAGVSEYVLWNVN